MHDGKGQETVKRNAETGKRFAAGLLAALVLFLMLFSAAGADTPYVTYTVNGYGDIQETQTAYLAKQAIEEAGIAESDVSAIGIGSPGTPDNKAGTLVYATNLPFVNAPMRKIIRSVIDLPVYIDNDANCAAMAESVSGAAADVADSVTITLGTGIGCGVIVNNRIFSGFNQAGSEFGHHVNERRLLIV